MAEEKNFETKIKRFLASRGSWYVKYFANGFTKSGIPDILACINGLFVAIEVKSIKGKPTALQLYNRDEIREAGGISIILYPEDYDKFTSFIDYLVSDKKLNERVVSAYKQLDFDRKV